MAFWGKFRSRQAVDKVISGRVEFLIAGLGNPGLQYEHTRHNAGFIAAETLARQYGGTARKMKFKAQCTDLMIAGKRCLLMLPQTYMNNSGEAVAEAMRFYKIPPEKLVVLFDDISLEPGKIRIRRKGTDGGHNGIKSIIALTGSENFPRVKIGVGKKPHPQYDLADWVLSRFSDEEMQKMQEAAAHTADAVALMVRGEIDRAMNQYNS